MQTETLEYKGYKIKVMQDEGPENPFEAWDCEPPLTTFYGGRHCYAKSYQGAPETLREVLHLLPASTWERGNRVKFYKDVMSGKFGMKEVAGEIRRQGNTFEAFSDLLTAEYGEKPTGWRAANDWFDLVETLLNIAGIPCLNTQSTGYCQGDVTLVLVLLTPEWMKTVGASMEHSAEIMKGSVELFSAWAWGDVYGVSAIHAPGEDEEGEKIADGSCWGFYGMDHEKSGLMEHARSAIDCHIQEMAETALHEPACLI